MMLVWLEKRALSVNVIIYKNLNLRTIYAFLTANDGSGLISGLVGIRFINDDL